MDSSPQPEKVDIVIMGGSFSGSAAALLLKRARPELKILIIEKSERSKRKVGESTSEVAACFLTKVLCLDNYLAREQIAKQGLRLWFNSPDNQSFDRCTEIGSYYQVRLPAYQLDRSLLDPYMLGLATEAGCELWRPANIREIELGGQGRNTITAKVGDEMRSVRAGWVIDASGKAALIARERQTWRPLKDHPTNAIWARFKGTQDLDSYELRGRSPAFAEALHCPRSQATNHLMGYGWWCWIIPLKNGDVSAGLTWDPRIFSPPEGKNLSERLLNHLTSVPIGREIFANATVVPGDTRTYSKLPYYTTEAMGDGWVCVGDAAGFMDPLYSQGLDYCSHGVYTTHKIILDALGGKDVSGRISTFNEDYSNSYFRWYRALYENKYSYLGDAELMWAAFLLDIGAYFVGPVRLVHEAPHREFGKMPYTGKIGAAVGKCMAIYNRRLVRIAEKRLAAGTYGRKNTDQRWLIKNGLTPSLGARKILYRGLWVWLKLEFGALFLPAPRVSEDKAKKQTLPPTLPANQLDRSP
ncbi:MAG: NAD(P)/FAD-dependent oxidoreductase [Verrucomicrobiales bacterium]